MTIKVLTKDNLSSIQALLEQCSDYLTFEDEEPVKSSAAQDLFKARPSGIEDKDKVVLGIVDASENLVGILDLIKSYPNSSTLTLGLMLLAPYSRGKGIGNTAYKILEKWAVSKRFNKIRLGVLLGNDNGLIFWRKMGFIETGEIKKRLSNQVLVLEKYIF